MPSIDDDNPVSKMNGFRVIGDSGTERYSGYFMEEPNNDWRDESRVENVELMRRTDATTKAALKAVKVPILSTEWIVTTKDDSDLGKEIRDFVEMSLFNLQNRTWKEFVKESMTHLDFGYSVFELIWGFRDGKVTVVDLAPRIQHSILKWQLDDGKPGVVQYIKTDEFKGPNNPQIPMEKLLVLTNDKEGDDITGQSVLRSAWKHFYSKDKLYRIGLIASERFGVGTPVITLPESAGDEEKTAAEELLANLRANELSRVVLPSGWELSFATNGTTGQNQIIEDQIKHHNREIFMAVLAGFLDLGGDATGSFALSKDQSSFFLKNVEDVATHFEEQISKQVIEKIVFAAYKEHYVRLKDTDLLPKLKHTDLGDIDFAEYSGVMKTLMEIGVLDKADPKMIQFIRKTFKLPLLTEEEMEDMEEARLDSEIEAAFAAEDEEDAADEGDGEFTIDDDDEEDDDLDEEDEVEEKEKI